MGRPFHCRLPPPKVGPAPPFVAQRRAGGGLVAGADWVALHGPVPPAEAEQVVA